MHKKTKRTISVTVKMSEEDLQNFMECAAKMWPGAVMTKSGMILGLARMGSKVIREIRRGDTVVE